MRRYNYFQAIGLSFFSRALYHDVARNWSGLGIAYVLVLVAVAWLPEILQIQVSFSQVARGPAEQVASQLPEITIANGRATVEPPGPHVIRDPETGQEMIIIDVTGEHKSLEGSPAVLLMTQTHLHMRNERRGEIRIYELSRFEGLMNRINPEWARRWLDRMQVWLAPVCYLLFVLFSFFYRSLQALFYSLFGLAFARKGSAPLAYAAVLRLACVATTPAMWLEVLRSVTRTEIPFWWLICFGISLGYLSFGVQSSATPESPAVISPAPIG